MQVYTVVPQQSLRHAGPGAQAAESAGYDGLMTMENAHDPFMPLAVAAVNTERITLMTAIAIAFPRSPMVVANAAWDLHEASQGRFVLGIGPQVKGHNERRFSVPWSAPAPRLREYVEALRAIWHTWMTGDKLDYRGEHYQFTLMTPRFTPEPTGLPMVPVTISAVGPAMLRLSGRVCDGVQLHPFCTRQYIDEVCLPRIEQGLGQSDRPRQHFNVIGGGFVATGPDEETVARSMNEVRQRLGFYGSTRAYWPVLSLHGLDDLGEKLNRMAREGQWEAMTAEVSDDVVRLFAAVGTHEHIAKEIDTRFRGVVDTLYTGLLPSGDSGLPPDLIQDIQRLPTAFERYAAF
ncbi:TIGR03617 family F420-dependent LLM class oxidoreductase [Candidatus Entotheonella palauensis]|uniref:TIGR03617 family F420-dependent LLM class oxidoreductase n=1 Tax=Candidatus Entotheonella palauensis TaxID=93172 RepID=UPI000B7F038D|nr:TIGR03617 family F420-dependent LLM class oxidoreductase [Candidatus Entotheonella palauensis]